MTEIDIGRGAGVSTETPRRAALHQALREWNDTGAALSADGCFLDLFAAQCTRRPDAVAVVDGAEHLTYHQLARRAKNSAAELRRRGVGTDVPVGLLLDRRCDLVVGALAILEAEGAYVPLDPAYPDHRLAAMVADAGIERVLTCEDHHSRLSAAQGLEILHVDSLGAGVDQHGEHDQASGHHGAAYVVYTSGSTGEPKGVVIDHVALAWYCVTAGDHYEIRRGDRLLQLASISFDISIGEIFPCLAAGATLVFPNGGDDDYFALCRKQAITVMFPPTALWQELAELAGIDPGAVPGTLRLVSFGGERVLRRRIETWRRAVGPRIRLVNGYGPTEATVEASLSEVRATPSAEVIGRPVAGTRLYVLDGRARPLAGSVGELAIGGPGLARGYLGRPAATASRFVPDPFAAEPGGRLYLTGDLSRWRTDGQLEIHGRIDRQIKIRGFRVEPGEVEARIADHPLVHSAAVVAHGRGPSRRLVAHVVLGPCGSGRHGAAGQVDSHAGGTGILGVGGPPHSLPSVPAELRRFLTERLPAHMVPARFELLDELPLTPNGKLDRDALARHPTTRHEAGPEPNTPSGQQERPRDEFEHILARIWHQVLRAERIGLDDDFFELGGDSILAIQIVTRAYRDGLRLTTQQVFEQPTIAALAAVATPALQPARADGGAVTGTAPLTPVQCWLFHDADLPERWHFNQSMMLEVRRPIAPAILRRATEILLDHHDALGCRFERSARGWRQVFGGPQLGDPRPPAPVTALDLSRLEGGDRRQALLSAAAAVQPSLDLESGPLLRLAWFNLGKEQTPRLLIAVHHLVIDAVSWSILLGDLERICRRLERGRSSDLPPRTTSYRAWADLQAAHADSAEVRSELDFWAARPHACPPLPRDFPDGANTVRSADAVSVRLPAESTQRLLRDVSRAYRTHIDDLLLTALGRTLGAWAGGRVRVDLESHGREEALGDVDLSRTVGWFTSTFPVDLDLAAEGDLGESLMAIKERLRQIPRRGIGYGILRYLAADARERLPAPAELCFNYLGQLDSLLASSELFVPAAEPRGREASRLGTRSYVLEIDGGIVDGRLWMNWHFSRNLHRRSTIQRLAATFRTELEALIEHCQSPEAGGVTPSDFPLACLDRRQLDRLDIGPETEDIYPLSPMQQGMLFHALYAPETAVYFEQSSWSIEGDLDADAFRRAWRLLSRRHAILRTAFTWQDPERPLQIVQRRADPPWRFEDWRGEGATEDRFRDLARTDRARGFDLSSAPLTRFTLVRVGERSWHFLWSAHHLLLDGWSIAALFDELFVAYEALRHRQQPRLPTRRPLRDFFAWLEATDQSAGEDFWRRTLAGFAAPTPLGAAPVRSDPAANAEAVEHGRHLGARDTAALQDFARRRRLTLSTLLQGAWALVLARHADHDDVVFGATVSGRPAELRGADSIIGLLINSLPVRIDVAPAQKLRPWLEHVQAQGVELRRYEHCPLVEIQTWSEVPPHLPLFDSLMVFENYPAEIALEAEQQRAGLAIGSFRGYSQTNYPLTLGILPGSRLTLEASVDPTRLEAVTATRLLRQLETVLAGMVEHGDEGRLGDLPLLTAGERHQLIVEWSRRDGEVPARSELTVHQRFWTEAARVPDAVALVSETPEGDERTLTYGYLERRAGRLSRSLQRLGVGVESRVALALDGEEMVVAMLAVLAAGGAYVPVAPRQAPRRLKALLDGSGASLLIARGLPPEAAEPTPVLDLDDWDDLRQVDDADHGDRHHPPVQVAGPRNLAYVLHTSGSTGVPKGVMIEHDALSSVLSAWEHTYRLRDVARRHLQVAAFTFDVASGDLLRALGTGATLVLGRRRRVLEPRRLVELLRRQRIDCVELVPALAELLARELETGSSRLEHMRLLAVGSDAWRMADLRRLARGMGRKARVVSSYGVTEAAIDSTFFEARSAGFALNDGTPVPIGRPFAGTRALVLDRRSELAAVGVPGELHLSGPGLARGYVGRPAATAERFVPDPHSPAPGSRVYRTGDRVRVLADGNLEILGRLDQQIKIRGFRIEPGEVERALRRHPAVLDAAVLARQTVTRDQVLAAFVVPRPPAEMPPALRAFLAERLPEPMVPSLFLALDALPLNRHGKVDAAELGRIELGRVDGGRQTYEEPVTEMERALADVWAEVLGVGQVGRHDDFFALGGHSLRAVRLMAEIERRFDRRLFLATLFAEPTLAGLARHIGKAVEDAPGDAPEQPALVEIAQGNGRPPFFCVHPVGGNVLCYADLARHLGADRPFYGLQSPGRNGQPLLRDVDGMARHYLGEIRLRQAPRPYLLGGWSMGGVVAFEIARRLHARGERVGALTLIDCAAPGSPSAQAIHAEPILQGFAANLGLTNGSTPEPPIPWGDLTTEQGLRRILDFGRRSGLLAGDLDLGELERLYRLFETNDGAMKRYRPRPYPGRLTLLRSHDWRGDPTLGWGELVGEVDVRLVGGDHYSMVREPHVRELATALEQEWLRAAP
ncbi:MAG: amino acid adenylation domain-containing protein [bacterium]|nr:amino acid adenylation domain-containing protein [bacterium]